MPPESDIDAPGNIDLKAPDAAASVLGLRFSVFGMRLSKLAALAALSIVFSGFDGAHGHAAAEQVRRTSRKSHPVAPSRAAPDVTATIPPRAPAPAQDDETIPAPFNLPTAPRPRMRACGERWQAVKMAGQAADQTWREFATKCLSEPEAPRKSASTP